MPSLPLHHHRTLVGYALVDPPLTWLSTFTWLLDLPRLPSTRPDVVVALLRDDPTVLPRCRPFTLLTHQSHRQKLYLSTVALRLDLLSLLSSFSTYHSTSDFRAICSLPRPHRVIHLNRSRVDCRFLNLREISPPTEAAEPPKETVS